MQYSTDPQLAPDTALQSYRIQFGVDGVDINDWQMTAAAILWRAERVSQVKNVLKMSELHCYENLCLARVSLFTGLDYWTGLLDWTTGLKI